MQLHYYRAEYKDHLIDIDIKSHKFPWLPQAWNDIKGYIFKVLMTDVPRGYLAFRVKDKSTLELIKLCVHPSHRAQGYGSELHGCLVTSARNNQKSKLITLVHEENIQGISFLRARGWAAVSIRKAAFPDGSDGYVFTREIIL